MRHRLESIVLALFALTFLGLFVPSLIFNQYWYKLDSVHIYDAQPGENPGMQIAGNIKQTYWGTYSVTVRRVDPDGGPGWLVCQGYPDAPFWYNENNYGVITKDLAWWLGGRDRLQNCFTEGMTEPGWYVANTCHFVLWPGNFKLARRCKPSNPFHVLAQAADNT